MLKFFESGDDADVWFKVGDTTFAAHKLILKMNAPILHSFCPKRGKAPVQINDTSPDVFRIVLRYVYGGDASELEGRLTSKIKDEKDIIEAADRYGIIGLKLAVEMALVDGLVLNREKLLTGSYSPMQRHAPCSKSTQQTSSPSWPKI